MASERIYLKRPVGHGDAPDAEVAARVSEMLLDIERDGLDAIRRWSKQLDGWDPPSFLVDRAQVRRATDTVEPHFRDAFTQAMTNVRRVAELQRATLVDAEWEPSPGVIVGQRQVPIERVGSYLPGGRYPLVSSPLMSLSLIHI